MFSNAHHKIIPFLFLLLCISPVKAEVLNEVETLNRVLAELNAINPLIEEAQRRSDRQDRLRFNYACLVSDINMLKQGLKAAIYAVRVNPGQYRSLCGDYGFTGQLGGEARTLSMLMNELQGLAPIINEARHKVDRSLRARMNYQALTGDLETIIYGLQNALLGSGDQPRRFPALRGGFSQ